MSNNTINATLISKLEEHVLTYMSLKEWATLLAEIDEKYTDYLLSDDNYIGNPDSARQVFNFRLLRDFFKEAAEL